MKANRKFVYNIKYGDYIRINNSMKSARKAYLVYSSSAEILQLQATIEMDFGFSELIQHVLENREEPFS